MSESLKQFAYRLRDNPRYLAFVLRRHRDTENLTEAQLARLLGIPEQMLPRVEVCMTPSSDSEDFADRVRSISDLTLADEYALTKVVRQFHALEKFASAQQRAGLPAAARDREQSEAEESGGSEPE